MSTLNTFGYQHYLDTFSEPIDLSGGIPARVTAVHRDLLELVTNTGKLRGRLKGTTYRDITADRPTVGDFVVVETHSEAEGTITKTLPRRTVLLRKDPDQGRAAQAVAANFDTAFLMASLNADLNLPRLERYLAAAWESGAKPVILLTKADLTKDYSEQRAAVEAIAFGVEVIPISAQTGAGLAELQPYLAPGETVVFLGSSGVGKSTLVNALLGEQAMAVKEIREHDSRGRHTTTHRQMLLLPGGALVIDTPGMRALTLWDVEAGLNATFGDVTEILERGCRFSNCGHSSEPGCAVLEAIDDGEITRRRWDSYLKLDRENTYYTDREAYSVILREQTKGWREYHRNKGKTIY